MDLNAILQWPYLVPLICALVIVLVLPLVAGYIVLVERKVMADMQVRLGRMRVGPHGLLQPIADAVKLLLKEDIIPESADRHIFWVAPLISVTAAMLSLSAVPIGPVFLIANLNIGLLFILGVSALGIFGIVLGGWSSNSHYSLLGRAAQRCAAGQLRNLGWDGGCGSCAAVRDSFHHGHHRTAVAGRRLVYFRRSGRLLHLSGGFHRGNQPRSV